MINNSDGHRGVWAIIVTIVVLFFLFLFFSVSSIKNISGTQLVGDSSKNVKDLIGVVEIKGVILDSQKIIENLITGEKNKKVKAIILRIDSPGGAVGPTQEIYQEILRIDKIKPVYASMASVAASGGYYVAAATRRIYANSGTLTGSIGVLMQFLDLSKLYDFAKVSTATIKSGAFKDTGNPSRPMTENEKKLMQEIVGGVYQQFLSDITRVRKDKIIGNLTDHARGQIFSGEAARKMGLVDKEASLWEAGREIHRELNLKGDFQLAFIKSPKKGLGLLSFFDSVEESSSFIKQLLALNKVPLLLYNQY